MAEKKATAKKAETAKKTASTKKTAVSEKKSAPNTAAKKETVAKASAGESVKASGDKKNTKQGNFLLYPKKSVPLQILNAMSHRQLSKNDIYKQNSSYINFIK